MRLQSACIFLAAILGLALSQDQYYQSSDNQQSQYPRGSQPSQRPFGPTHRASGSNSCLNRFQQPIKCSPEFVNAAFNAPVESTNTCGLNGPSQYCIQSAAAGSKTCDICDNGNYTNSHPPRFLVDHNQQIKSGNDQQSTHTWWQSESLFDSKTFTLNHQPVNLTLNLGKAFEVTYVRLRFQSPRAQSFAIYKKYSEDSEWEPWQFYSHNCELIYNMTDIRHMSGTTVDLTKPFCTSEFSDISPLSGGNVVYSLYEGRDEGFRFDRQSEPSEQFQKFITATQVRIVLHNMNTFGDEIFHDERVLRSYYYAITDLSVGGM